MSAHLAAYGRIGADPVQRQSQAGKSWTTATIAVRLAEGEESEPLWLQVVAFGRTAETLARHSKGDLVSIAGRLQLNRWRDRDGGEREQLQVIADAVLSARSVRPAGGRKRGEGSGPC